ncbi:MAG: bifunctional glutamate N-acetyltransferase/amino-acid acetyltransferase ArgJ [Opitutales bacterium]
MSLAQTLSELAGDNPPPLCPGFEMSGVACDVRGMRNDRLDLALVRSQAPCTAAGVFTTNQVKAAPVVYCQEILDTSERFHGILANSGNANACTGAEGLANTRSLARAAESDELPADSVFVCATGRIGRPLPMDRLLPGVAAARENLNLEEGGAFNAARAILTSDTREKTARVTFAHDGKTLTVSGFAKGAGMIEPNMATMLAFVLTDVDVPQPLLQAALKQAVAGSFNTLSIDGDMSTNDTVLLLANGASGLSLQTNEGPLWNAFTQALGKVCKALARKIVADGERITKLVTVKVTGADSPSDAEAVARAIGNSLLVKTAWYGSDPNWGRVACAAGYAGVALKSEQLTIAYDTVTVFDRGLPVEANIPQAQAICARPAFEVRIDLGAGRAGFDLLTTDLSEGYVDFNKSE